jgi:hypothetical protein
MTSEQRFDRLERIAKLFAKAGLRARSQFQKQYEILLDAQMRTEAKFERNEERFAKLAEAQTRLAESQVHTDQRLDALIDIIREGRNGDAASSN